MHVLESASAEQGIRGQPMVDSTASAEEAASREGQLLSTGPGWLSRLPWLLVGAAVLMLSFAAFSRVPDFASGTGVVRPLSEVTLRAPAAGQVEWLDASVRQHVEVGSLVGRLLRTPDKKPQPLWAPISGTVMNAYVRPGQRVSEGEAIIQVVDERVGFELVTLVAAAYGPQLARGMAVVVRLHGYRESPQLTRVDDIGPALFDGQDAARWADDFASVRGSAIVVRSRLPSGFTLSSGQYVIYRKAMTADADIQLGRTSILTRLLRRRGGVIRP